MDGWLFSLLVDCMGWLKIQLSKYCYPLGKKSCLSSIKLCQRLPFGSTGNPVVQSIRNVRWYCTRLSKVPSYINKLSIELFA